MIWLYYAFHVLLFQAKGFTVVNMQGKVYVNRRDSIIRLGSTLFLEDKIRFEDAKAALRLAGAGGTFLLRSDKDPRAEKETSTGMWAAVGKSLLPTKVVGKMQARAGFIANQIGAENYFKGYENKDNPMLIIDTLLVPVSNKYITDTSNRFFYVSYMRDKEIINKKIPFKTAGELMYMIFDSRLLLIDGKNAGRNEITGAKIFLFNKVLNSSIFLSDINLSFKSFNTLQPELCLVRKGLENNTGSKVPDDTVITELLNYLRVYYGQTDEDFFKEKFLPLLRCKN